MVHVYCVETHQAPSLAAITFLVATVIQIFVYLSFQNTC